MSLVIYYVNNKDVIIMILLIDNFNYIYLFEMFFTEDMEVVNTKTLVDENHQLDKISTPGNFIR